MNTFRIMRALIRDSKKKKVKWGLMDSEIRRWMKTKTLLECPLTAFGNVTYPDHYPNPRDYIGSVQFDFNIDDHTISTIVLAADRTLNDIYTEYQEAKLRMTKRRCRDAMRMRMFLLKHLVLTDERG